MDAINNCALEISEKIGIIFSYSPALDNLEHYVYLVDRISSVVRFSHQIVNQAVERIRYAYKIRIEYLIKWLLDTCIYVLRKNRIESIQILLRALVDSVLLYMTWEIIDVMLSMHTDVLKLINPVNHKRLQGIEVNEKTLALDVIKEVGIGGNYLQHPHTADNFRSELLISPLFKTIPWERAHSQDFKGMKERADQMAKEIC